MSSLGFQFKQFFIAHDQCAMKVNTDGILLGALAAVENAKCVVDCGTGSGLVAIMLAQRSAPDCQIIGLELEPNAAAQAECNAHHSPWASRISMRCGDVLAFSPTEKVDLVVANPPYFAHSLASRNGERDLARMATQSHLSWLAHTQHWLAPQGKMTLILPFEAGEKLIAESPLPCVEKWTIHTKPNSAPKRLVLTFSQTDTPQASHSLTIYDEQNRYTPEFRALTQDFYLNG